MNFCRDTFDKPSALRTLPHRPVTEPGDRVYCIAEDAWTVLTPATRRPAQELPRPRVPYIFFPPAFFSILGHFRIQVQSDSRKSLIRCAPLMQNAGWSKLTDREGEREGGRKRERETERESARERVPPWKLQKSQLNR